MSIEKLIIYITDSKLRKYTIIRKHDKNLTIIFILILYRHPDIHPYHEQTPCQTKHAQINESKEKGVCQITGMRHVELYTMFFIIFFVRFFFSIPGWVPGP